MVASSPGPSNQPNSFWALWPIKMMPAAIRTTKRAMSTAVRSDELPGLVSMAMLRLLGGLCALSYFCPIEDAGQALLLGVDRILITVVDWVLYLARAGADLREPQMQQLSQSSVDSLPRGTRAVSFAAAAYAIVG